MLVTAQRGASGRGLVTKGTESITFLLNIPNGRRRGFQLSSAAADGIICGDVASLSERGRVKLRFCDRYLSPLELRSDPSECYGQRW